jgi:ribA/ribD-fused uncharacterized protein
MESYLKMKRQSDKKNPESWTGGQQAKKKRMERLEAEKEATRFEVTTDGESIVLFKSGFSPLSNFYPEAAFKIGKTKYCNMEQWIQANKATMFGDKETHEQIMETKSPRVARELGEEVKGFDEKEWNKICVDIVKAGLREKVKQNRKVKKLLVSTGEAVIVEAKENDDFWAIGIDIDDEDVLDSGEWTGANNMGKLLMNIRSSL